MASRASSSVSRHITNTISFITTHQRCKYQHATACPDFCCQTKSNLLLRSFLANSIILCTSHRHTNSLQHLHPTVLTTSAQEDKNTETKPTCTQHRKPTNLYTSLHGQRNLLFGVGNFLNYTILTMCHFSFPRCQFCYWPLAIKNAISKVIRADPKGQARNNRITPDVVLLPPPALQPSSLVPRSSGFPSRLLTLLRFEFRSNNRRFLILTSCTKANQRKKKESHNDDHLTISHYQCVPHKDPN